MSDFDTVYLPFVKKTEDDEDEEEELLEELDKVKMGNVSTSDKELKTPQCETMDARLDTMLEHLELMANTIIEMKAEIRRLKEQNRLMNPSPDTKEINNLRIFPIIDRKALKAAEKTVSSSTYEDVISYIQNFIKSDKVSKIPEKVFSKELVLTVNWSGGKGRLPIKDLKLFNKFVFDAVKDDYLGYKEYEELMKKGFRNAKLTIYRNKYLNKKLKQ